MFLTNGPGDFALGTDDRALALAEAKALARVTTADDDATLGALIDTALGLAERFTGRLVIGRPVSERVAAPGWTALGASPVSAITGVSDATGNVLAAPAYAIDIDADGTGRVRAPGLEAVTVDYTAGAAPGWPAIPPPIRSGIVLLAAHLYEGDGDATPPPAAVTALWRPFRVLSLEGATRC